MELQFNNNSPVRSAVSREAVVSLEDARKPIKIGLAKPHRYRDDALFTVMMRDLDMPRGQYVHGLSINANHEMAGGDEIIQYTPPEKEGHRYAFEIYSQPFEFDVSENITREGIDLESIKRNAKLSLVGSVTATVSPTRAASPRSVSPASPRTASPRVAASPRSVSPTSPRVAASPRRDVSPVSSRTVSPTSLRGRSATSARDVSPTSPRGRVQTSSPTSPRSVPERSQPTSPSHVREHNFVRPGLSTRNEKYCECVAHVQARGGTVNPYAVCAKSTGGSVRSCSQYYDFEAMPERELLGYADARGIYIVNRTSRDSILGAIYAWERMEDMRR